ncbi:LuxR C-terminal-related transcriptional regulator [Luteolibacter marinus]|uniref:LuxR C-terminal-related transcriptional regulator n=1 Tax=Luteolibacter marinus TaxID=2776705 RepID=UPI00272EAC74|nr:LuxR C-terminal-related transcriptional regulator [Luteolibacter marinus]
MERLGHSDYQRLLDFIAGLQEPVAAGEFGKQLVRVTEELLPGAIVTFDQIEESSGHYAFDHNLPADTAGVGKMVARLMEVYRQNPIYNYIQNGGTGPVVDIADLMPRREFHRTDFYQDIHRPFEIRHQVQVILSRPGWISNLTINRDLAIPERAKTLLGLAARHIALAHRNMCRIDRIDRLVAAAGGEPLTPREGEVFRWLREGKRNAEIGVILGCSPRTVDKHVENILRKTGAETRTAAVRSDPGS